MTIYESASILGASGRPAQVEVQNFYEAAQQSPQRSSLPGLVQSANRDANRWTRDQLIKNARYLYRNSGVFRGIVERIVTYVLGTGIIPVPSSSSKPYNSWAKQQWKTWCKYCDIGSRQHFHQRQRVLLREQLVSGDSFAGKTFSPDTGRRRIQLFEAHQFGSQSTNIFQDDPDGVNVDSYGRALSYRYLLESNRTGMSNRGGPFQDLPADNIIHFIDPERARQGRGVTLFASALEVVHDVHDILKMEKAAVKEVSETTDVIETENGELSAEGLRKARFNPSPTETNETSRVDYYKSVIGPKAKVIKRGDKFTPYEPKRPSPAWQGFVDFLCSTVVLSSAFPPSVLLGIKMGGADTRKDLATAERIVSWMQFEFITQLEEIWLYVMDGENQTSNPPELPDDWRNVAWQVPKAITVDYGREAQQDREDVRFALVSRREYHGRYGDYYTEQDDQIIEEAKERLEKIKAANLSVEDFVKLTSLDPTLFRPQPQQSQNAGGPQ